jgi:cell division protein FtsZ
MATRAAEARGADPRPSAQPAAPQNAPQAERPRFGINSLIGRMTGQPTEGAAPPAPAQPAARTAAQPRPSFEAQPDPEQERADIPAFLRRQAN